MKRILLAGATGYLGSFILKELQKRKIETRVIVRTEKRLTSTNLQNTKIIKAEVTRPESLIKHLRWN